MASRDKINTIAAIERVHSADALAPMLEGLPVDLPNYSDLNSRMHDAGNTVDSLRRVAHGIARDPNFDHAVLIGALVHVITDQQERIEALEGKPAKTSSRSKPEKTKKAN